MKINYLATSPGVNDPPHASDYPISGSDDVHELKSKVTVIAQVDDRAIKLRMLANAPVRAKLSASWS